MDTYLHVYKTTEAARVAFLAAAGEKNQANLSLIQDGSKHFYREEKSVWPQCAGYALKKVIYEEGFPPVELAQKLQSGIRWVK
jgi:hypothetical protein